MDLLSDAPNILAGCRSIWTTPLPYEEGAPARRIIHCRDLRLSGQARLDRLGVRLSQGYLKCGSTATDERDWVRDVRVRASFGQHWQVILELRDLQRPADADHIQWFDLGGQIASAVIIEIRRCGVDGWWSGWELAMGGVLLEGEVLNKPEPHAETGLELTTCDLAALPSKLRAERRGHEVRYRTRFFEVGFDLNYAAFSYFSLDGDGTGRTARNLLREASSADLPASLIEYQVQGVRLHAVGEPAVAALSRNAMRGTVAVQGATVTYELELGQSGQIYRLRWEVREDRLVLNAERTGERPLRAWTSSAWALACDSRVIPVATLGRITRQGETGLLDLPVLLHAPGFGTLNVSSTGGTCCWRSDSIRPQIYTTTGELKLGEVAQPEGDYLLLPGHHAAEVVFAVQPLAPVWADATMPREVERALQRHMLTALTYRPDTATFSNNSNGVHCYMCMDSWSATAVRVGEILPGFSGLDMLRDSLERWLDDSPAYGSGNSSLFAHRYEDEYLGIAPAAMLGLAEFLLASRDHAWAARYRGQIRRELELLRARDLDGDGLIESPYRLGISGEHHWSTAWYDILSFGWKCAYSNAQLYAALQLLAEALPAVGQLDLAEGLAAWAERLKANYTGTFLHPETGWLAGWRCKDDRLHDYAFPAVNGAAVAAGLLEEDLARSVMRRLWDTMLAAGFHDFRLGVPTSLYAIPDADVAIYQIGRPFGDYMNGGANHAQACHFVNALYRVGMTDEADRVLLGLCSSLADDTAIGGCDGAGVDWRMWDGTPSGYEGLLTDQFAFLATAFDRYRMERT